MKKVNPGAWLAWVLERFQYHPADRINAQNAEAEAKDAA
jgi:hypothetical protein